MANFIKKNWQKDAGNVAVNAGLRFVGAGAAAFTLTKLFSGEPRDGQNKEQAEKTAKTMQNIGGPLLAALGLLGDMTLESKELRSICQGWTTYSALHALVVFVPSLSDHVGVNGIPTPTQKLDAKLLSGVNANKPLGVTITPPPTQTQKQLGETTMAYTGSNPEELNMYDKNKEVKDTDNKTYNNDWPYLLKNIEQADKITRTVAGVDDEAAALMGVASNEEAALLMGMF